MLFRELQSCRQFRLFFGEWCWRLTHINTGVENTAALGPDNIFIVV